MVPFVETTFSVLEIVSQELIPTLLRLGCNWKLTFFWIAIVGEGLFEVGGESWIWWGWWECSESGSFFLSLPRFCGANARQVCGSN